jgi:hypothetical protein
LPTPEVFCFRLGTGEQDLRAGLRSGHLALAIRPVAPG